MGYRRRNFFVWLLLIVMVIGGFYLYKKLKTPKSLSTPTPSAIKSEIEGLFDYVIPEDLDSTELKDVSGGEGRGIATKKFENNLFTHAVLADLPDLASGEFYEGWLVSGEKIISTGKLKIAKGGFLLEFTSKTDYSDYNSVVVTLEKKDDKLPETHILEGSF